VEHLRGIDPTWEIGFASSMVLSGPRWFSPTFDRFNRTPGWIYLTIEVSLEIPKASTGIPMGCHLPKRSGLGSAKATDTSIRFHHKLYGTKWNTLTG